MSRVLVVLLALFSCLLVAQARGSAAHWSIPGCVIRWNQMNMRWGGTLALVKGGSACSVRLAYAFNPINGTCPSDSKSASGLCTQDNYVFDCRMDSDGAYWCPEHAQGPTHTTGWNAHISHGFLTLDKPPTISPSVPLPTWAQRYPIRDGFIRPWLNGALRAGLTFDKTLQGTCEPGSESTSAPSAIRCSSYPLHGIGYLLDPCFPQRSGWSQGGVIAACATLPGSTTFVRLHVHKSPSLRRP
jgi:hypothetical protein